MDKRTTWTRMKTLLSILGGAAVLLGAFVPLDEAAAQVTGIRNTRHNLGSSSAVTNNRFSGTDEVCVFCHTPHGSNTAVSAPLWNKATPATTYTVYNTVNSSTIDGAMATDGVSNGIGSVSIACLSCHDGTQAMNNMINQPGTGGYNAGGANMAGTWTAGSTATTSVTAAGLLQGGIAELGSNLRNDHPIGIQYCGGGYNAGSATGSCGDADFIAPLNQVIGGTRVFWVETGGNTTRNKTDMVLYNRAFGGANPEPSVECASCHDPHVENTGSNPTFLRVSNSASAVCLSCHVK
ncbi:MAG: cytochrome c3 family protein [Betaproteobacteria bacterium]|nr:cytochrome c3 family protein [Betaproteobacteria bacterium]